MFYDNSINFELLGGYLGVVLIIFLEKLKAKSIYKDNKTLVFISFFASVFFHELAHYIIAKLLNGKPVSFSVFPKKEEYINSENKKVVIWTNGEVECKNITFYNAGAIGLAPLLLFVLGYFVYADFFSYVQNNFTTNILYYVLLSSIVSSAIPSKQDIKVAFFGSLSVLFIAGSALFIYLFKIGVLS